MLRKNDGLRIGGVDYSFHIERYAYSNNDLLLEFNGLLQGFGVAMALAVRTRTGQEEERGREI
jgi:xylose isomerase